MLTMPLCHYYMMCLFVHYMDTYGAFFFVLNICFMPNKKRIKNHKSYLEQLKLLKDRGMCVSDEERALKKLKQVGYYRLSGYWYRYRLPSYSTAGSEGKRGDNFCVGTTFENVYLLYLFDQKLKTLLFDGITRIETYIRAIISYEMGKIDPLCYEKENFIDKNYLSNSSNESKFHMWKEKLNNRVSASKKNDVCIKWYLDNYEGIPIWVITEIWEFGTLSKYYGMLNDKYKQKICAAIFGNVQLGNSYKKALKGALQHLNVIRNKCAHHSRVWNHCISTPKFDSKLINDIGLPYMCSTNDHYMKIFGTICLIWKLINLFSDNSKWLKSIAALIEKIKKEVNDIDYSEMGFSEADLTALKNLCLSHEKGMALNSIISAS